MYQNYQCQYYNHDGEAIIAYCLSKACELNSQCCLRCVQQRHTNHLNDCKPFIEIKKIIGQYIEETEELEKYLNSLLEKFKIQIQDMTKRTQETLSQLRSLYSALSEQIYQQFNFEIKNLKSQYSFRQGQRIQPLAEMDENFSKLCSQLKNLFEDEDNLSGNANLKDEKKMPKSKKLDENANVSQGLGNVLDDYFQKQDHKYDTPQGQTLTPDEKPNDAMLFIQEEYLAMGTIYQIKNLTNGSFYDQLVMQVIEALKFWEKYFSEFKFDYSKSTHHQLFKANVLTDMGRYQEAIQCLDQIIQHHPDEIQAYICKGKVLNQIKEYDQALSLYDKAIYINRFHGSSYIQKGITLNQMKRYVESIICYDQVIEFNPSNIDAHLNKGMALKQMLKLQEALDCYNLAIEIEPCRWEAYFQKGIVLQDMKQYDQSIESLGQALKIHPKNPEIHFVKANTLYMMEKCEEAVEAYDKVIEYDPKYIKAFINKGNMLTNLKKFSKALQSFQRALELDPNQVDIYINQGITLEKMHQYSKAIECYEQALQKGGSQEQLQQWIQGLKLKQNYFSVQYF